MLVGLGIDVASIERIERAMSRFGDRFVDRLLSSEEKSDLAGRADRGAFVAGRFATKEAALKALGGPRDVGWKDLRVTRRPSGAPTLTLKGSALKHAQRSGVSGVWVSITHDAGVAAAVVVLESLSR
jgi:holo-[acyl-carrier protein] synthase